MKNILKKILNKKTTKKVAKKRTPTVKKTVKVKKTAKISKVKNDITHLPFLKQKIVHDLSKFFDTSVELKCNKKGKGKLIISFKNDEDFERIVSTINK